MREVFKNKKILITGGTGSFGKAVIEKYINTDINEIRIFSRDEKKQNDLRIKYQDEKIKFYIGDVREFESINAASVDVDYIFCAAALKQVPSCEFYPMEAVKTNIIGIDNTIKAAINNHVKSCVVLSTDKAVSPINAMGISKALSEKVAIAKSRGLDNSQTIISITRYGNVMASRGSVIPLFVNQIKNNQPITVTDLEMTRFMMSLEDAIDLVVFAFQNAKQGDIFVQKAPACTIQNLVKSLKIIFKSKSSVKLIGTRHGEKKHEVLLNREEVFNSIEMDKFFRVPLDQRGLNYENYFDVGEKPLSTRQDYASNNTKMLTVDEMVSLLLKLDFIQFQLESK